jgi:hypothetical protein
MPACIFTNAKAVRLSSSLYWETAAYSALSVTIPVRRNRKSGSPVLQAGIIAAEVYDVRTCHAGQAAARSATTILLRSLKAPVIARSARACLA